MDVYRAVAWLGWVPNILAAELLIRTYYTRRASNFASLFFGRLRRKGLQPAAEELE